MRIIRYGADGAGFDTWHLFNAVADAAPGDGPAGLICTVLGATIGALVFESIATNAQPPVPDPLTDGSGWSSAPAAGLGATVSAVGAWLLQSSIVRRAYDPF